MARIKFEVVGGIVTYDGEVEDSVTGIITFKFIKGESLFPSF